MTETSGLWDTVAYTHPDWATMMKKYRNDGLFYETGNKLQITENTPQAMNVLVGTGAALIQGHWYNNSAVMTVTISAADASYPRWDRVVLRRTPTGSPGTVAVAVLTGTPAASPSVPSLTQNVDGVYEYSIGKVYVDVGTTAITTAMITAEGATAAFPWSAAPLGRVNIDADGALDMATLGIHNVLDPASDQDADTKLARNTAIAAAIAPIVSAFKKEVVAATTANITIATALNNGDTLDGVTLATSDRVLVKNQSSAAENGIYIVGATPTRATDFDASGEILGAIVAVIGGTVNAGTHWKCTNTSAVTVGSTAIDFLEWGGYTATLAAGTVYRVIWPINPTGPAVPGVYEQTSQTSYTRLSGTRVYINAPGTVRVAWTMSTTSTTVKAKVYVNGVAAGTEKSTTSGDGTVNHTDDVTVAKGDYLELYAYITGSGTATFKNLKVGCSSQYVLGYIIPGS